MSAEYSVEEVLYQAEQAKAMFPLWSAMLTAYAERIKADKAVKMAPVQGYAAGIPWSLHLEAYDAYCKRYGRQNALIDLEGRNCRGGFGTRELDEFIPGWRERVSEIGRLRAEVARLSAQPRAVPAERVVEADDLSQLRAAVADWDDDCDTEVPQHVLMRLAEVGLLEADRFILTKKGQEALAAAPSPGESA